MMSEEKNATEGVRVSPDTQRLLDSFLTLVRIDSPSHREAAVATWCADALREAGCSVRFDDSAARTGSNTGNLLASLPGTAPGKLYFSAHMDTVNPCEGIEPVIKDGVISSAGETILGGDDKVGIAAIIELVRTLSASSKPHPEVGVLLSVAEEIGLQGASAMDTSEFNGEPCLVLDANGKPGVVIIGAPYHHAFTATFTGKASHAGIEPEKGVSAIALASAAVLGMKLGRLDEHTTANVGTISGGSANNIVPGSCVVTGEFRAMDEARISEVQAQIAAAIDDAVRSSEGTVEVEWVREYPGFEVPEDDPLVQLVLGESRALGFEARATLTGGGSDANIFASKGLRPLVLGTGMTDVHGLSESLAVTDLEDLTRLCLAVAYAYRG